MKKLLLLFMLLSAVVYSQGIFFSEPLSYVADTIYSSGQGPIVYNFYTDNCTYVQYDNDFYAKLWYPDDSSSDWMRGEVGGWWVTKAGTYEIEGKAWATDICLGGSWGWRTREAFSFQVVDPYSPATPSNFSITTYNNAPKITWSANTEHDLDYYEVWRQWDEGGTPTAWALKTTTTSTSYVDNDFVINGKPYAGTVYYKILAVDINDNESGFTSVQSKSYTSTTWKRISMQNETDEIITEYSLKNNYPNPFNPSTNIEFSLPNGSHVNLTVYNSAGQEVEVLVNDNLGAGRYVVQFDATDLPSGLYIYAIQSGKYSKTKKMVLIK